MGVTAALAGCASDGATGDPVRTSRVEIPGEWVFTPAVIEVTNGTTVTWVNNGGQPHTITFSGLPVDMTVEPGAEASHTFNEPGSYDYTCTLHPPGMKGKVIVV